MRHDKELPRKPIDAQKRLHELQKKRLLIRQDHVTERKHRPLQVRVEMELRLIYTDEQR